MNNRTLYIDRFTEQLKIWDAKINRLNIESEQARGDVKLKYLEIINDLMKRRQLMQEKLKKMMDASDDAWIELKKGFEKSWNEMSDAMKKAASEFF